MTSLRQNGRSLRFSAVTSYLALGSNMGDRRRLLDEALCGISAHSAIRVEQVSSLYETDPVGYADQPDFYNAVIRIGTVLPPIALLRFCQSVERRLGRRRDLRWGPRTVDIDILLYDQLTLRTKDLVLPHPRMLERDFVMVPLRELKEGIRRPVPAVRLVNARWYTETCIDLEKKIE